MTAPKAVYPGACDSVSLSLLSLKVPLHLCPLHAEDLQPAEVGSTASKTWGQDVGG